MLLIVCGSAGCASFPLPPTYPAASRRIAPAGLLDDRPASTALRPGDEVVLTVGNTRDRLASVDARGDLHVASGRDVPVAGLQIAEAETRAREAIQASEKDATVHLRPSLRAAPSVIMFGAITKPGRIALSPGLRLADAVALRGGLLAPRSGADGPRIAVADTSGAVLLREGGAVPISLADALAGKPGHNVYLHPGDELYVPFASQNMVSVFGQVRAPRVLLHYRGLRLTEALTAAGGITRDGDKTDVRLVRGSVEQPVVYRASLRAIAAGKQSDVVLAAGDVVFVEDHPMEDVGEVLRLVLPLVAIAIATLTVATIASTF